MKRTKLRTTGMYVVLLLGAFFAVFPVFYMLSTAFKPISEVMGRSASNILPSHPTFEAFQAVFKNYQVGQYILNSCWTAGASTLIAILFATLAGYGFSRFQFRGKGMMLLFILATQMFPSVMLFIPYYKLLGTYHLSNTLTGLILVYTATVLPFCSWMMYGYVNGIPKDLDEAARIDGCGQLRTFFQVVAPLTLPGILSTGIYAFVTSWNEYMFTALFTSSDMKKTLSVAIGQMAGFDSVMWNEVMAASAISSLPLIVLFIFLQRYFISGMTAGSVKG